MNSYIQKTIDKVKARNANEPEFIQTVEEVFTSIEPVIEAHPEYEKADILGRLTEPDRSFSFHSYLMNPVPAYTCAVSVTGLPEAISAE